MNRVIRDGNVAVLVSPGFGAGWYSWHNVEALLFDPQVVQLVDSHVDSSEIESYCIQEYGYGPYYGGACDLVIEWVPVGARFRIAEYDGDESLVLESKQKWIVA